MGSYEGRNKSRCIGRGDLFESTSIQGMPRCLMEGETCGFYLRREELGFRNPEIPGQDCQGVRSKTLENGYSRKPMPRHL